MKHLSNMGKFARSLLILISAFMASILCASAAVAPKSLNASNMYPESTEDKEAAVPPGIDHAWLQFDIDAGTALTLGSGTVTLKERGGSTVGEWTVSGENTESVYIQDNVLYVCFDAPLETLGKTYELSIPKGLVSGYYTWVDEDDKPVEQIYLSNDATTITFTLSYLVLTSSTPAEGVSLPSFPAVSSAMFYFDFGTSDDYGDFHYGTGSSIILKKNGAVYATWPTTKEGGHLRATPGYSNSFTVDFKENLQAGSYTLEVPQGLFSHTGLFNGPLTLNFTVTGALSYSVVPAPGNSASKSAMAHVTITYPETSSVRINDGAGATLSFVKNSGSENIDDVGYTLSASGNVLTLSCNPAAITASSSGINVNWFKITIPAGSFTVTCSGEEYTNDNIELTPYQISAIAASDLTFTPPLTQTGLYAGDLGTITVGLSENVSWLASDLNPGAANAPTLLYVSAYPFDTTFNLQYKLAAVSEDKKTLTLQLKDQSDLSNYTEKFPEGPSVIRIYGGKLSDSSGVKNTQMDINAWNLEGVTSAVTYKTIPGDKEVVTAGSISSLELYFTRPVNIIDENAMITLSSATRGELKQVRAGETTFTTGAPRTAKYTNLFGSNTENDDYIFTVPAGVFQEKSSGWINEKMVIRCKKAGDFEVSGVSPQRCAFSGTSAAGAAVVAGEAREYYRKFVITYPEDARIRLASGYQSAVNACVFGETAVSKGYAGDQTVTPTPKGNISVASAEVIGNQLILTLSDKYNVATTAGNVLCLRVAEGVIDMIGYTDGVEGRKNNPAMNFYFQGFDAVPNFTTNFSVSLDSPTGGACLPSDMGSITLRHTGGKVLYFCDQHNYLSKSYGGFNAELFNASGTKVATYTINTCAQSATVEAAGGSKDLAPGIYQLKPSTQEDTRLYTGAQPYRKKTFNIPATKITYTDCKAVEELTYYINVVNDTDPWSKVVLTAASPDASFDKNTFPAGPTLYTWTVNNADVRIADWSKSITLKYQNNVLLEIPVSEDYGYFRYNIADKRMTLDLSKHPQAQELTGKYGSYTIVFPVDLFSITYINNPAAISFDYTYNRIVDRTYSIRPADKAEFESGGPLEITVEFTKADDDITLTYDSGKPAELSDSAGNEKTAAPVISGHKLTFTFYNIAAGDYNFSIESSAITFTAPEGSYPVTEAIGAAYTVKESDPCTGYLADHITLDIPSALSCDRASTTTLFNSYGMGIISLGLDVREMNINTACGENITLVRDNVTLVGSIKCNETPELADIGRIMVSDMSMTAASDGDGDVIGGGDAQQYLMMLFDDTIYEYGGGSDNYRVSGTYTLTIPDGAVMLKDGSLLHGISLNYVYDDAEKVYKYVLSPDPVKASPLQPQELFANISVRFRDEEENAATSVRIATSGNDVMAEGFTLTDADGNNIPLAEATTDGADLLTLKFGDASTGWSAMKAPFSLVIKEGYVSVNSPYWNDDFDAGVTPDGNFKGLEAVYAGPFGTDLPELSTHVTLSFPTSLFCDKLMTTNDTFGTFGMLFIGLGIDTGAVTVNRKCSSPVTMSYGGRIIGSIDCSDEGYINLIPAGSLWDNPEVAGGRTVNDLFMIFDEFIYEEGADHSVFQADGAYTVVIPVGALLINEEGESKEMNGMTLVYHYTNGMFNLADLEWEIYPVAGETVNIIDPQEQFDTVKITFTKAGRVDFKQNWRDLEEGVTLTCPVSPNVFDIDGDEYDAARPYETIRPLSIEKDPEYDNVILFRFREINPYRDWDGDGVADGPFPAKPACKRVIRRTNIIGTPDHKYQDLERYGDGEYTLNVPAGLMSIDSPEWNDNGDSDGNVPAIEVKYFSDRSNVPVDVDTLFGEDVSRFDVYAPDGKVIRSGVTREALYNLEPGIYIINGHKVRLTE